MMDDSKAGYQATPSATLEQQMMDACAPKNEREWWAFAEIGRLRAEVASLTAQLQSGESFHAVAVHQRDAAWGEVEALKATLTQQCKGYRADVEKLEAEVETLRGITPELPPRPPDGGGLPRYGLRHNGSAMPMSVPMADGYWTPYHLAIAEVEALRADAQAVAALLPGPYYMDPPDGGSVTVIEQLRRMAADAARYRWIKRGASFREERDMGPGGCWSIFVAVPRRPAVNSLDTAIDAAMAQGKV